MLLSHSQEFTRATGGTSGCSGLNDHLLLPGYSAYANTAAASLYPTNGAVADLAHAQHALVGYVHPFDETPDPKATAPLTNALPIDVARGKVDYYEVVGFSEHRTSAAVWYRLLNCGFKPAAAAGTDAMANFASLRGPVGMNRVYALDASSETRGPRHGRPTQRGALERPCSGDAVGANDAALAMSAAIVGLEGCCPSRRAHDGYEWAHSGHDRRRPAARFGAEQ